MKGLLAKKLGMTQLFNADGTTTAVTVLEAGPCRVIGLRTAEKDGYAAARIGFDVVAERKLNKAELGVFKKASLEPHRHVVEIRGYEGLEAGQELKAEIFAAGEIVDVTSTSKGKGFQGLIKRHKFSRGPESHGSMNVRQPGAIGSTDSARVFKGLKMSGQMGNERVTARAYKIVRVDPERNLLLLKGGVPGAKGALVLVRQSTKRVKVKGPAGKPTGRKV
ncbi:MAG TPA: 50S ribosomal protein L3 [Candidatus Dormibacteraeota bacterium]|jgi:large subunit ribosomal protein L3|nr:50S ribosomal protein L3 [Candidatus Dormibacteraeota bacterium]